MTTLDRVRDLVEPMLHDTGFELYDLEQPGSTLRITVERPDGVPLDALAHLTRLISRALDEEDAISGSYTLEVSSPGLERRLRNPEHFRRAVGETISLKTFPGVEGDRRVQGQLTSVDEQGIVVRLDDGERTVHFDDIAKARTTFEWGNEPRTRNRPRSEKAAAS